MNTGSLSINHSGDDVHLSFKGDWTLHSQFPTFAEIRPQLPASSATLHFHCEELTDWDSLFLILLTDIQDFAASKGLFFSPQGLPPGIQRLLVLAAASPEKKPRGDEKSRPSFLEGVGDKVTDLLLDARELVGFTGVITLSYLRLFRGKAQFQRVEFFGFLEECGPSALPIVSLISVLVGVILAFVGAVQLQLFGAEIYIANLVGLGMTREMGAMMAAIIMSGRTGAAFAAQLGTMQVNEEIDALQTMGIDPTDFLVLPRLSALLLMMPLLALWANLLGVLGGFFIAWMTLDISMVEYYHQTINAVPLRHLWVGLTKAFVFGYLVAFSGCLRGMQCGRSASAVGEAATSAVVTAIVMIVVSDAAMTVIFKIVGV